MPILHNEYIHKQDKTDLRFAPACETTLEFRNIFIASSVCHVWNFTEEIPKQQEVD
jgi:hypothetical protein